MIKFTNYPNCEKCGHEKMTISYCQWAPMSIYTPGDFLNVTCDICGYEFKMRTKDYKESGDGE